MKIVSMDDYKYGIVELVRKYWLSRTEDLRALITPSIKTIIVGDVHGDLNQLLPPLIATGTLELLDEIPEVVDEAHNLYIPKYTVHAGSPVKIYFLGDIVDEGPCSRECAIILANVMKNADNVYFVFGNHDLNQLAYFPVITPDVPTMMPSLWQSLKPETLELENVSVHINTIRPPDYAVEYWRATVNALHSIFHSPNSGLCFYLSDIKYVVSHCVLTNRSVQDLVYGHARRSNEYLRKKYLINEGERFPTSSTGKADIDDDSESAAIRSRKNITGGFHQWWNEASEKNCAKLNNIFKRSSCEVLQANKATYSREESNALWDSIVGHTIGGIFTAGKLVVNVIPVNTDQDRQRHLVPSISSNTHKRVLYFDFGCSCFQPLGGKSSPDFVMIDQNGRMTLSCLPALMINYDIDGRLCMEEYNGKTKFDGRHVFAYI